MSRVVNYRTRVDEGGRIRDKLAQGLRLCRALIIGLGSIMAAASVTNHIVSVPAAHQYRHHQPTRRGGSVILWCGRWKSRIVQIRYPIRWHIARQNEIDYDCTWLGQRLETIGCDRIGIGNAAECTLEERNNVR